MDEKTAVIIVDDDAMLLPLLKEMFEAKGYRCETCTSAQAAIDRIRESRFHIMLTDITIPGMNGLELTEKAKKLRPDMATIVMTGFIDDFSFDRAIEAGASDFIKKPFTMKEMLHRVTHVQLQERLRILSMTDELTGLYNRRGFFTLAKKFLKLANRRNEGIYMLYADLDHLKTINDTSGHHKGDQALVDIATILRTTYRESDVIARIGGDEFVVMPLGTARDDIKKIIARLQMNIEDHNAARKGDSALSLSLGTSYYDPGKPCPVDELIAQAEKMMYEQKRLKHES